MKPDLAIKSTRTVGRRIAANTGLMVGAKALGVVLGVGALWIAIRALTPAEFGTLVFLHAYMLFFGEVINFKSWQSIIRFGTDDIKAGDSEQLSRLIKFGAGLDFISVILGYIVSVILFGFVMWCVEFFPQLAPQDGLDLKTVRNYAALYCLVILFRQIGTSIGVLRLFDRFRVLAIEALIMPSLRLLGALYAFQAGWGVSGFLCVWFVSSLTTYLFMISAGAWELKQRHLLGPVIKASTNRLRPREGIWPFVTKSTIDSTLIAGQMHLPLILVMVVFGPIWAGVYKIAEEVAKLLSEGFTLLDQVIYPELAKLITDGNFDKIWKIVMRAASILLCVGFISSCLVYFLGPDVLTKIFGQGYRAAAPLASLLVPAAALLGIIAPLYPIFYAADRPERAIYVRGSGLLIYIISFLILSISIGKMGPGWAMIAGNGFAVLFGLVWARQTLRVRAREH